MTHAGLLFRGEIGIAEYNAAIQKGREEVSDLAGSSSTLTFSRKLRVELVALIAVSMYLSDCAEDHWPGN